MTLKVSTGLRDILNVSQALGPAMAGALLDIYAGAVPATADAAIGSATLLCTISSSSGAVGLLFATASSGGTVAKSGAQTWSGVNLATGTAAFFRLRLPADDGTLSTSQARIQGAIATSASELNLASVSLTIGVTLTIDTFSVTQPTS